MIRTVDLSRPIERQPALPTVEDVRRVMAQARDEGADVQRPINIHVNLGDGGTWSRDRDEAGFRPFRSKLFWVVVVLSLATVAAYGRTRQVCQSFKDTGRFFYGMGVERCVGVLIKQPFARAEAHLETINRSY